MAAVASASDDFPALAPGPVAPPLNGSAWGKKLTTSMLSSPSQSDGPDTPAASTSVAKHGQAEPGSGVPECVTEDATTPSPMAPTNSNTGIVLSKIPGTGAALRSLVLDANAMIAGTRLEQFGAEFVVTSAEALAEVRDRRAKQGLGLMFALTDVGCKNPSAEALKEVCAFAKKTGDYGALSTVDLKLLALVLDEEVRLNGRDRIRTEPPKAVIGGGPRQKKKGKKKGHGRFLGGLPGWGDNVPNLKEWEQLEEVHDDGTRKGDISQGVSKGGRASRILGVSPLIGGDLGSSNMELSTSQVPTPSPVAVSDGVTPGTEQEVAPGSTSMRALKLKDEASTDEGSKVSKEGDQAAVAPQLPPKTMSGVKQTFKEGVVGLTVQGSEVEGESGQWVEVKKVAGGRQQFRRGKKGQRQKERKVGASGPVAEEGRMEGKGKEQASLVQEGQEEGKEAAEEDGAEERGEDKADSEREGGRGEVQGEEREATRAEDEDKEDAATYISEPTQTATPNSNQLVASSETTSEQKQPLPRAQSDLALGEPDVALSESGVALSQSDLSLGESDVALVTSDFAMQNVALQMGLRVISGNGTQVKELHRWVLRCSACFSVSKETDRLFCPSCGNGNTLCKVSLTVDEEGKERVGARRRFNLRGTRYPLPLPKGGREGAASNPILREDQLPLRRTAEQRKSKADADAAVWFDDVAEGKGMSGEHKGVRLGGVSKDRLILQSKRNPNVPRKGRK